MEVASVVDRLLPGPGSLLDRASSASQAALRSAAETPAGWPVTELLHGNRWLGHPLHPVVIAVPVGAWSLCGWHDLRAALSGRDHHDSAADAALRFGVAGAVVAVTTGLAQYLDTRDSARRETAVHAALNNIALTLYLGSWAARSGGQRSLGRGLAAAGLGIVGVSGYLGGDLAFRHGVGVRPQALRDPERPAPDSGDEPIDTSDAHHS